MTNAAQSLQSATAAAVAAQSLQSAMVEVAAARATEDARSTCGLCFCAEAGEVIESAQVSHCVASQGAQRVASHSRQSLQRGHLVRRHSTQSEAEPWLCVSTQKPHREVSHSAQSAERQRWHCVAMQPTQPGARMASHSLQSLAAAVPADADVVAVEEHEEEDSVAACEQPVADAGSELERAQVRSAGAAAVEGGQALQEAAGLM